MRHAREEVLELLRRECPRVDTAAAAFIVTELVTNVALHAYPDDPAGRFEVDVECGDIGAAVTVRDWGRGFGGCPVCPFGTGLSIVMNESNGLRIAKSRGATEVRAQLPTVAPPGTIPAGPVYAGRAEADVRAASLPCLAQPRSVRSLAAASRVAPRRR